MASVTLTNLRRHFGTVKAVDDISLQIDDGEFIALLGPSGCGKTTTLRMIAGLEVADGGAITIGARTVTHLPPRERDVAMVFQDYALYPHMTVEENVGYPLKVRGVGQGELKARVEAVARRLQIDELLARRPGQLSGGQQQRVALARAVVHKAQVTLYDEPLSNLDTKLRLEARAFLKHLQREVGVTSFYVTHDQAEAMALADRIVIMNRGQVMQVGTPMEVYRTPANTFVASFVGSPPMNLLPCTIDTGAQMLRLDADVTLAWDAPLPSSAGGAVTLGVRPEHITLHTTPTDNALPVALYVVQELGGEVLVVTQLGAQFVSVRLFTDELPPLPERLWLTLDSARAYFYDEDGALLT